MKITLNSQTSSSEAETLSFHNINYTIDTPREIDYTSLLHGHFSYCRSKESQQILFNISGRFTTGLNAILGPTGCGKTSLLDILADRKDPHSISGPILINGSYRHPSFKYTVGYVVQDNIFCETLTVRENLVFSANLRLPKGLSREEINDRVASVINELALENCADQYMGTALLRGVSGGEKKRTSIGMELVLSPSILFLDEPTTGLDASTADSVMACLKELSQRGRTVIFSIHQPRYSIFKLFDNVMFMCKGRCLFYGPTWDVISYFSKQGYEIEEHSNPADFVLDILIDANRKPEIFSKLHDAYVQSRGHKEILVLIENKNDLNRDVRSERERHRYKNESSHSMLTQISYISKRTIIDAIRNPQLLFAQAVTSLVIGLFVGCVFYKLEKTTDPGIHNRMGAIFFVTIAQLFSGLTSLEPFIKDRALFLHEYVSGYYKILPFFLARVICDIVLLRIVPPILFGVTAYFMMGFGETISQFFMFLLTIIMTAVFGSALGFFVSATLPILAVAIIVSIFIFAIMWLFAGFVINLTSVSPWLSWMQWLSAFRYTSNVLLINELKGLSFCIADMSSICPITGEYVLDKQTIDYTIDS